MLDNPNLNIDKTIELISDGKDFIGISLIIIVIIFLYIYRYQIALFLKYGFSKNKNSILPFGGLFGIMKTDISDLEQKDLEDKVDSLLQKYENVELEDDNHLDENLETDISKENPIPPIFRSLKVKRTLNEIIYYFINDGGEINNITIKPTNDFKITIEPQNYLKERGSGYFKFVFDDNRENEFYFILSYYNILNKYCEVKYYYSYHENHLNMFNNMS